MRERTCEDCGDPVIRRRLRCPACRMLVCGWCFGHVHNRAERLTPRAANSQEPTDA
jgi:hypothetical protein